MVQHTLAPASKAPQSEHLSSAFQTNRVGSESIYVNIEPPPVATSKGALGHSRTDIPSFPLRLQHFATGCP